MTFTIIGIDRKRKEIGIACFSKAFAVGGIVPAADLDIGAIGTQSYPNVLYKGMGLGLMKRSTPEKTVSALVVKDPGKGIRQVLLMNKKGECAAFTGKDNVPWAGNLKGKDCICAGNMLVGKEVLTNMVNAFERLKGDLAERLLAALEAGYECGGDKRKEKVNSAGLIVERRGAGVLGIGNRFLDLRVDYSTGNSIEELKHILAIKRGRTAGKAPSRHK